MTSILCVLHTEVPRQITLSDDNYKSFANLHSRLQEIAVGDEVMLRVPPQRFPPETWEKLHIRCISPYRVMRRIGSNAFELNIPCELGINPVFNVEELTP